MVPQPGGRGVAGFSSSRPTWLSPNSRQQTVDQLVEPWSGKHFSRAKYESFRDPFSSDLRCGSPHLTVRRVSQKPPRSFRHVSISFSLFDSPGVTVTSMVVVGQRNTCRNSPRKKRSDSKGCEANQQVFFVWKTGVCFSFLP